MPCAWSTLQSRPLLLLGLPGRRMTLQLCTTALLLVKHSITAAAASRCPGRQWGGRWSRLARTSLLMPAWQTGVVQVLNVSVRVHINNKHAPLAHQSRRWGKLHSLLLLLLC